MHAKKGELTFPAFLSLFGFLLLAAVLLIAFNSFSVRQNPQNLIKDYSDLSITGNAITGKATYNGEVLTVSDIEQGITLSAGWNTFVWPTDEYDPVAIDEAFDSIISRLHFAYDYDNQEYWFNPNGAYAAYNTHDYYSTILFDEIEPGVQYGVYLAEVVELQYNFPRAGLNRSGGTGGLSEKEVNDLISKKLSEVTVRDLVIPTSLNGSGNEVSGSDRVDFTIFDPKQTCVDLCAEENYAYRDGKPIGAQSCMFASYVNVETEPIGQYVAHSGDVHIDAQASAHSFCFRTLESMVGVYERLQCFCG